MEALRVVWQGTAQAWECDEMGHMNVRHYLAKAEDALAILCRDHGVAARPPSLQHIRYHRETRAGTPLVIRGGFATGGTTPTAYFEFVSPYDGVLRATLLTALGAGPDRAVATVEVPAHGQPRGLPAAPPAGGASIAAAEAAGLMQITRCLTRREMLDEAGLLRPHQVIGLVADGVAHLMMRITPGRGLGAATGGIGGAALEQRLHFLESPALGDTITVRSGIMEAGAKTMRFVHWLLNERTGRAVATCEVVAVAFDLTARKAVPVTEEVRERVATIAVSVGA